MKKYIASIIFTLCLMVSMPVFAAAPADYTTAPMVVGVYAPVQDQLNAIDKSVATLQTENKHIDNLLCTDLIGSVALVALLFLCRITL